MTGSDRAASPAILAAIQARPGITQPQIVEALGIPAYRVRRVLTQAKRDKLVGDFRLAGVSTWWPAEMVNAAKQRAQQKVDDATRDRRREIAAARFRRRMVELRAAPELPDSPVRRQASAFAPLPFKCSAPASVFHLGGML